MIIMSAESSASLRCEELVFAMRGLVRDMSSE